MRLLLDTHVLLWWFNEPERLREACRAAIADEGNIVLVSSVTIWEAGIKQSLGKLTLKKPAEAWLPEVLQRSGFEVAELGLAAALRVRSLAWHHRDPFDRLLIAQALEDGYTLVTHDEAFASYGAPLIRA